MKEIANMNNDMIKVADGLASLNDAVTGANEAFQQFGAIYFDLMNDAASRHVLRAMMAPALGKNDRR